MLRLIIEKFLRSISRKTKTDQSVWRSYALDQLLGHNPKMSLRSTLSEKSMQNTKMQPYNFTMNKTVYSLESKINKLTQQLVLVI